MEAMQRSVLFTETQKDKRWAVVDKSYVRCPCVIPVVPTPDILNHEILNSGVNNPTYYVPKIKNKGLPEIKQCRRKRINLRPKFTLEHVNPAKLTKIPGFPIWKLEFQPEDNSRTFNRPLLGVLALVFAFVLLLSGVALITHFAAQGTLLLAEEFLPEETGDGSVILESEFRIINRKYHRDLLNSSSLSFLRLSAEILYSFDVLLTETSLASYYHTADEFRFSNGSVVANFRIHLKHPVVNAAQRFGLEFVKVLEKSDGLMAPGILQVDVQSIRLHATRLLNESGAVADVTEGYNLTSPEVSWSSWSQWSSCLNSENVCHPSQIKSRFRACFRNDGTPADIPECSLKTGHREVEVRPCMCPTDSSESDISSTRFLSYDSYEGSWSQWSPWTSCSDEERLSCHSGKIQRRTRSCISSVDGETLVPYIFCSGHDNEKGVQIKICSCLHQRHLSLSANSTKLQQRLLLPTENLTNAAEYD